MLTSDANRELIALDRDLIEQRLHAYFGLRERGETEPLASLLAEDCVYMGSTWVGQVVAVRREGREACLDFARRLRSIVEHEGSSLLYCVIDGDRAASARKVRLRARGTGRAGEVAICSYFRFHNGEIAEILDLADTEAITRLLQD